MTKFYGNMDKIQRFKQFLISYYYQKRLVSILIVGAFLRLFAAFWSEGYAMHDDHFVTIEPSYSWTLGLDYGKWLQQSLLSENPLFYNYLYPKVLSWIFILGQTLGITTPKSLMLLIRIFHGLFSLVSVFFGYKISKKLFTDQIAIKITWILACFWLFPFIGVRNLVEVVCTPFIMMGFYFILSTSYKKIFLAAICFSIASSIRFQTILMPIGVGIAWLYVCQYRTLGLFTLSFILFFCLIDGTLGLFYFHKPFGHILNYVRININLNPEHSQGYFLKYSLILLAIGLTMGVFWFLGFIQSIQRKYILLSLPLMLFILIHSIIPNQQERFIFPILPLYIITGIGCLNTSYFSAKFQKVIKSPILATSFWILNCFLLFFFITYYPKKSRVELVDYFYSHRIFHQTIVVDYRPNDYFILLPNMYMNYQNSLRYVYEPSESPPPKSYDNIEFFESSKIPIAIKNASYLVLYDTVENTKRIRAYSSCRFAIKLIAKIESSYLDRLLHYLNPVNDEGTFFIYKLEEK